MGMIKDIYDVSGRIIKYFQGKSSAASLEGFNKRVFQAAQMDRTTASWSRSYTNINLDIRNGLQALNARARDLAENDPYAKKFLKLLEKNVVGPDGFSHRNKAYDFVEVDGELSKVHDKLTNQIIEDGFAEYGKLNTCLLQGNQTMREATALELKSMAVDGEVFLQKLTGSQYKYGFCYQQIESQMCDTMYNRTAPNGNKIIMGIEYTKYMQPVNYYFRTDAGGDPLYITNSKSYVKIPASQIIHLYKIEFIGQLRGISWFLPTALRMNILKGYQEAVLLNARSSAMKNGVLVPSKESDALDVANVSGTEENSDGDLVKQISPGETYVVPEGYDFETYDPTYPSGQEGGFTDSVVQGMASGFDVDFPSLASNWKGVNYTSSRAASLDARGGYAIIQSYLIEHKMEPIRIAWLEVAMLTKAMQMPDAILLKIISDLDKYNKPTFYGFKGAWVDQWKENKADAFGVDNNLETMERTLGKRGYNLEEFVQQKKYEKKLLKDAGLTVEEVVPTVAAPAAADEKEDDDESGKAKDEEEKSELDKILQRELISDLN